MHQALSFLKLINFFVWYLLQGSNEVSHATSHATSNIGETSKLNIKSISYDLIYAS